MRILHEVVSARPRVLSHPPAQVLFMKYGDSSLDFEVRFWCRSDEWLEVRSEVLVAVYEVFSAQGIEIPFPQRDVHLRSGLPAPADPARPASS